MKICLINNLYKPYNKGGAEQVIELLHNDFLKKDYKSFIISTFPENDKKLKNNYLLKSKYYNLEKIPIFFRLFWHIYDMFDFWTALKVRKIIKQENPDLIITHNLKGLSFLIPLFLPKDKEHIHTLHDIQLLHPSGLMFFKKEKILDSFFVKIYIMINRFLFSKISQVNSPSKWLLELHKSKGFFKDAKLKIIPNPILINKKNDLKKVKYDKKKQDSKFVFLFVGQIEEHKGIIFLLEFFKKYLKSSKKKNLQLNIVGNGSLLDKCKKDFLEFDNIKFLGKLKNKEVKVEMQNADCLLVPSLCYENSPTVIYEAFSNNLSVIASRIGGIPELISYFNNGLLFEPLDENDLKEKIEYYMKNYEKFI